MLAALFFCALGAASSLPHRAPYNTSSRRVPGAINVHLVPHTHDDVGWLKTVDEYFTGSRNTITHGNVNAILTAIVKELAWNPDRKAIYAEQAFFQRFYEAADARVAALVRGVVASGQLEFVNGGWSMHDEAAPAFVDMLDQTSLGHRLLREQFNATVRVGWQIDPFGHSTTTASVFASPAAGISAVFFMRADWQDVAQRMNRTATEMIWQPSPTRGAAGATFAGILFGGAAPSYCTVPGLSMDFWSLDEPVIEDVDIVGDNVAAVVNRTVATVTDALRVVPQGGAGGAATADGADVMLLLGCDFEWENAGAWFDNTDKLIHHLNLDGRVNAFYSTPSIYAAAKIGSATAPKIYETKEDDFYPYDFFPHGYLTGYYSSRPALKGYIRESSSVFQAAKQLQVFTGGAADTGPTNPLYSLERALGVVQHHDAVTGTSRQAVAYDYAARLAAGRADAEELISAALAALAGGAGGGDAGFAACALANASICAALEARLPTVALVYNQQPRAARVNVLLPAALGAWAVLDARAAPLAAQLLPLSDADVALRRGYYGAAGDAQWIAFQVDAPPAGYAAVFIVPAASPAGAPQTAASAPVRARAGADAALTNGNVTLTFDGATGLLAHYADAFMSAPLAARVAYYNGSQGLRGLSAGQQGMDGAYMFRPNSSTLFPPGDGAVILDIVAGAVVAEARQAYAAGGGGAPWATAVTRLWAGAGDVEVEYTVGPVPTADGASKDVVARYETGLASRGVFFTDANGRDSNRRVRDTRRGFNLTVEEPVAGNYYPVAGFIFLADAATGATLSVAPDRAQGGASLADGALELMLHRRILWDDKLGVGEALDERGLDAAGGGLVVRARHRLSLAPSAAAGAAARRGAAAELGARPLVRLSALAPGVAPAAWAAAHATTFSGLAAPLPPALALLTAHALGPARLLLRVAHAFEAGEGGPLSGNATVALAALFKPPVALRACTEMTVTGAEPLADAPKVSYGGAAALPRVPAPPAPGDLAVTLAPMDVRTFECDADFGGAPPIVRVARPRRGEL